MHLFPKELSREESAGGGIRIRWSDDENMRYTASALRANCPCAVCREKETAAEEEGDSLVLPVLSIAEAQPLSITAMQPIGNYAYNIAFSDGHDSGIFTIEYLRELGELQRSSQQGESRRGPS